MSVGCSVAHRKKLHSVVASLHGVTAQPGHAAATVKPTQLEPVEL